MFMLTVLPWRDGREMAGGGGGGGGGQGEREETLQEDIFGMTCQARYGDIV